MRVPLFNGDYVEGVTIVDSSPLEKYVLCDSDEIRRVFDNYTLYYGFATKEGSWYIQEVTPTTNRFYAGSVSYVTAWNNRTEHPYTYIFNAF